MPERTQCTSRFDTGTPYKLQKYWFQTQMIHRQPCRYTFLPYTSPLRLACLDGTSGWWLSITPNTTCLKKMPARPGKKYRYTPRWVALVVATTQYKQAAHKTCHNLPYCPQLPWTWETKAIRRFPSLEGQGHTTLPDELRDHCDPHTPREYQETTHRYRVSIMHVDPDQQTAVGDHIAGKHPVCCKTFREGYVLLVGVSRLSSSI